MRIIRGFSECSVLVHVMRGRWPVWREEQSGGGAGDVRPGRQPLQDGQEVGQGRPDIHQNCRETLTGELIGHYIHTYR